MPSIDSGFTSTGVIIGVKPYSTACWMASCSRPSCSSAPGAGEEVEPAARHLRAALGVDRAEQLAELEVVARVGDVGPGADLAQHHVVVLAAGRRTVLDHVGTARWAWRSAASASSAAASAALTCSDSSLVRATRAGRSSPLHRTHLVGQLLLLGPQGLERLHGRPARLVGAQQLVDEGLRLAPGTLAGADQVGVLAEQSQVNHEPRAYLPRGPGSLGYVPLRPGVGGDVEVERLRGGHVRPSTRPRSDPLPTGPAQADGADGGVGAVGVGGTGTTATADDGACARARAAGAGGEPDRRSPAARPRRARTGCPARTRPWCSPAARPWPGCC